MKGIVLLLVVVCAAVGRAQKDACPPEQADNWEIEMLLRHEDCDKFYKCTFGEPVALQCPNDLFFNLETWQCDWRHNVDCTDRVVPDETTVAPTPTVPETTPTTTTSTTTTTPAPTTTSTTTTTTPAPTTTSTTTTTTPAPTTTSTTTTTTPRPTTPSTSTTIDTNIDFMENGCPVNPRIHWLLPHEEDCNKFYYCVWGRKVLTQCPDGLHFNTRIQVCDWVWDAGCSLSVNKHSEYRQMMRSL